MSINFTIPGRLPSLNEFLDSTKRHKRGYYAGNDMKRKWERYISAYIPSKYKGLCLDGKYTVVFKFYEENYRRDPDNISSVARKFILDALVKNKVLQDDSQRYIKGLSDTYDIDKHSPRIEVCIKSA